MPEGRGVSIDVTAVGEILVDFVAPDVEGLAAASSFMRTAGGAPANVAVGVARLGGSSALVSAVGDDAFGTYLREMLESSGVDTSAVRSVAERTTVAFVARNLGGIPDFLFYRGSDAALCPDDVPAHLIERSAVVYFTSMPLQTEPSASATLRAVRMARAAGALVAVDPNLRPSSWPSLAEARRALTPLIEAADVLKVNDAEALLFAATDDLDTALRVLGRKDCLMIVTRGQEGCIWRWHGDVGVVPSPAVAVTDTTGAGDAFTAGLLAELVRRGYTGESFATLSAQILGEILGFACAAGACSCTLTGAMASLPRRREVETLQRLPGRHV